MLVERPQAIVFRPRGRWSFKIINMPGMLATADPSQRFVLPHDSPLLANMAALWAADPALARQVEAHLDDAPYPTEPSRSGPPTVALCTSDGRRIYLHSRYEPLDEAGRIVESAEPDEKAVFCVLGLGLGYHVLALFERIGDEPLVVVFEPDLRLLRTAFEHLDFSRFIAAGRLIFITAADRSTLMLRLNGQQAMVLMGLTTLQHPASMQLHGAFHQQAAVLIDEFVAYCRTTINTLVLNGRRTAENIARNLAWYAAAPGIARLKDRHAAQPAIIVSAGPSLRKNKHLLREAAGKAVLIAVQTTLQPLLEMGVRPHYVTSLDYHDICTRFFENLPADLSSELIAEPKASTAVLDMYPGPLSILGNDFAQRMLRELPLDRPCLRSGATVAHLAFYLAEFMGCDPIIFIGQDLGFSDGLCYTPGTSYEDVWRPELGRFCTMEMKQWEQIARERPILRQIEDQQGRPMYTEERLFSYLQQFERDFAVSRARIIDATEGGARKRGATTMTLADALARYCATPLPPAPDDHPGPNWSLLGVCADSLRRRRREAEQIERIGRDTLPLLEEVREHLDDQARVNRLIARIDALRARMNQLNDCYELVTQLTQHTELLRFQNDRKIAASRVSGLERQKRQLARDIVNVGGVIEAARQFQSLVDEVIATLESRARQAKAAA